VINKTPLGGGNEKSDGGGLFWIAATEPGGDIAVYYNVNREILNLYSFVVVSVPLSIFR